MALSTGRFTQWRIFAAALSLSPGLSVTALADTQIGSAAQVVNSVTGTLASRQTQTLRAGIDVFQNETINTAYASASRVVFEDKTQLSIGPVSQVVLDRFVFDPNPAASVVAVSIAKGVARFSTGLLPKPNYQINTPSCTIGVRGTVFTTIVSETRDSWVSVEEGQTSVTAQNVTVIVNAGQTTFVAFGQPPTPPGASTAPPAVTTQMDALLLNAGPRHPPSSPPPAGPAPYVPPPAGPGPYVPPPGGDYPPGGGYYPTGGSYGPAPGYGVPGYGVPGVGGGFGVGIGLGGGFGGGEHGGSYGGGRSGGGYTGGGYTGGNTGSNGGTRGR